MPVLQASRRLVKSPPELWAEVSDAASLARHLGEVGEIRITRLEPETTVAWEGELASGTVELAPAGWGTSVTLTAEPTAAPEAEPVARAAEPEPEPAATAEPEPPTPEPTTPTPEPTTPTPGPTTPAPEPAPVAASPPTRRSWLARLLGRPQAKPRPANADRAGGADEDDSVTPVAESPRSATGPARSSAEAAQPETARPEAARPEAAQPEAAQPEPPAPEPEPAAAPDPLERALTSALDSLGQAHHRPFSRG